MCGDDTKITQNSIPSEDLSCSLCRKFGHEVPFCWMRVRSSKELGLTSSVNLALNNFFLRSPRALSFAKMQPSDCIITFVTNLLLQIHVRASDFTLAWESFALSRSVLSNLIEPSFSQLCQGLAFGIPVFLAI